MSDQENAWVEVFRAEDQRQIRDASLVLLAVKVTHRVDMNAVSYTHLTLPTT